MCNDDVIMHEGVTMFGGIAVNNVPNGDTEVAMSDDGKYIMLETDLDGSIDIIHIYQKNASVGVSFCDPAGINCGGGSTVISGTTGSGTGSGLHLSATSGSPLDFGYFLVSSAFTDPGVVVSNGTFCLGGMGASIGRYNFGALTNSVGQFTADGSTFVNIVGTGDVSGNGFNVPTAVPNDLVNPTIDSGETWNFQLWHRDDCITTGASNFSNGLSVTF